MSQKRIARAGILLVALTIVATSNPTCAPVKADNNHMSTSIKNYAGTYYAGDGLGFNNTVVIMDDGRFTHEWKGCLGTYSHSAGEVSFSDDALVFSTKDKDEKAPSNLTPVKWGERLYLIDSTKMLEFCNAINQGNEPREKLHGMSYIRMGDEKKSAPKMPELPLKWRDFVLASPLKGKIVRMIDAKKVEVNLGASDGLKKGMLLTAGGSSACNQLRVIETSQKVCIAAIDMTIRGQVSRGQMVSSRFAP